MMKHSKFSVSILRRSLAVVCVGFFVSAAAMPALADARYRGWDPGWYYMHGRDDSQGQGIYAVSPPIGGPPAAYYYVAPAPPPPRAAYVPLAPVMQGGPPQLNIVLPLHF
jgi:hypothetical protein